MDDLDLGSTIRGFSPGQKVFNRYTLKKILGRGGMGVVWLARDEELERDTALKFLPEVIAADRDAIEDMKREVRRAIGLAHPHIVKIHDFVTDGRMAAVSMEYVAGSTLTALRHDEPGKFLSFEKLTIWVGQLCEALAYAHTKAKVVHRDLKPANLMVDADGDLKVLDFGIAASVSDSVSRVSAQAGSSGTPVYMSPQQMMGEKPAVTDDIYALGATLYDLLTGKPPFYSGNIILQVQNKVPPTMQERRAEFETAGEVIPSVWEDTVASCLAKEAEDRPQSANEVWARLEGTTKYTKDTKAESEVGAVVPNRPDSSKGLTEGEKVGRDLRSAPEHAPSAHKKSKTPLLAALLAGLCVLASAGYYFGFHVPEQKRLAEVARLDEEARVAADARERARVAELNRLAALRVPVALETTPTGAEIFVNGQSKGVLDQTLPLPLGTHTVRAVLDGYDDYETTITVKEQGQANWKLPLVRSTGLVRLTGEPEQAPYWFFPVDAQNRRLSESAVGGGGLPNDGFKLPVGRYEVLVQARGKPEFEHREIITVRRGETVAVHADVRGGTLKIDSTPAGATVVINGKDYGPAPITQANAYVRGQRLTVGLSLPGYESLTREITIGGDYAEPTVWNAALSQKQIPELKVDFRYAPRNFKIRVNRKDTGSVQRTTQGKTVTTPTNYDGVDAYVFTMTAVNEAGHWERARAVVAAGSSIGQVLEVGTVLQYDRMDTSWQTTFVQGGFTNKEWDEILTADTFLSLANPAMSLDRDTLPAGPAKVGREWAVPLRAVGLLPFGHRLTNAAGSVRGRIVRVADDEGGWVDLEYTFDLTGSHDLPSSARSADFTTGNTVAYAGTMTMRLIPAEGYVSQARLQYQHNLDMTQTLKAQPVMMDLFGKKAPTAPSAIRTISNTNTVMEYETEPIATQAAGNAAELLPGVMATSVEAELRRALNIADNINGVVITKVAEDSPYHDTLLKDMVIIEINRVVVTTVDDAKRAMRAGRNLVHVFYRNGHRYLIFDVP